MNAFVPSEVPDLEVRPGEAGPWVLPFAEVGARDLPRVGGKGANLGEMARAGFPVPPGFCITTAAFARFLAVYGEAETLFDALAGIDEEDLPGVQRVGAWVREQLLAVPVPGELEAAIVAAWEAAGVDHAYAVRSSATAEDLPDASFAGQQESYLNVRGHEALIRAVRACWVSLFTDRAILYRVQNGFSHRDVLLSVVVQRMVLPEVSGILFTADPITGNRHRVVIEASYGLGEALVAGLVSPDRYQLDKRNPTAIEVHIGDKQVAIRPLPEGGTREEELLDPERSSRVLGDEQVRTLARLATSIEAHYGTPQDIEWCLEGGKFYIVQSRPITSLYPMLSPAPEGDNLRVFLCFSHVQVMLDPMPPMAHAIWRSLVPFGKPADLRQPNPHITAAGGRLFFDLSPMLLHPITRRILPAAIPLADTLAARILIDVAYWPRFMAGAKDPTMPARTRTLLSWMGPIASRMLLWLWVRPPERALSTMESFIAENVRRAERTLEAKPAGKRRLKAAFEEVLGFIPATLFRRLIPMVAPGILAQSLVRKLVGRAGDPKDFDALGRGLLGNVTTEMDLAVADLADVARPYPALKQGLEAVAGGAPLERLRHLEGGPAFLGALEGFLKKYGMRGPSEIDASRLRYRDDPRMLIQAILGNLGHEEVGLHRRRHEALNAEGWAAADRLVAAARRGPLGFLRARVVKRLTRVARHMMAIREHPKFLLVNLLWLVRRELLEAGDQLVRAGRIDARDDVFFLDLNTLLDGLEDPTRDLRGEVRRARADLERYYRLYPPKVMTSEGECPVATHATGDFPPGALVGSAASAGVVEGVARVILDPTREVLHRGEILVAPFTDPGWTPLFINAAGLVMEVGGMMTHGSVVAREYGIPAVVCVPGATKRIRTGQRIRVNGELGYVEILPDLPGDAGAGSSGAMAEGVSSSGAADMGSSGAADREDRS